MPLKMRFFLEGKYFGAAEVWAYLDSKNVAQAPTSRLYFCGACGYVYASLPISDEKGKVSPWESRRGCCRRCETYSSFIVPDSIWTSIQFDRAFIGNLPREILLHEFFLHYKHFTKELSCEEGRIQIPERPVAETSISVA